MVGPGTTPPTTAPPGSSTTDRPFPVRVNSLEIPGESTHTEHRQERVKSDQARISPAATTGATWCAGCMTEDIVGLIVGLLLMGYLLYALVRPEKF